jgi:hypothetical protein
VKPAEQRAGEETGELTVYDPSFAAVLEVEVDAVQVAARIPERAVPDVVGLSSVMLFG